MTMQIFEQGEEPTADIPDNAKANHRPCSSTSLKSGTDWYQERPRSVLNDDIHWTKQERSSAEIILKVEGLTVK